MDINVIANQSFKLRINSSFVESIKNLYKDESFIDVVIICAGNISVKCHKAVLASVSQFVKELVSASNQDIIHISLPDISHTQVETLLDILYEGKTSISLQRFNELKDIVAVFQVLIPNVIVSTEPAGPEERVEQSENNGQGEDSDVNDLLNSRSGIANDVDVSASVATVNSEETTTTGTNIVSSENGELSLAGDTANGAETVSTVADDIKQENELFQLHDKTNGEESVPDFDVIIKCESEEPILFPEINESNDPSHLTDTDDPSQLPEIRESDDTVQLPEIRKSDNTLRLLKNKEPYNTIKLSDNSESDGTVQLLENGESDATAQLLDNKGSYDTVQLFKNPESVDTIQLPENKESKVTDQLPENSASGLHPDSSLLLLSTSSSETLQSSPPDDDVHGKEILPFAVPNSPTSLSLCADTYSFHTPPTLSPEKHIYKRLQSKESKSHQKTESLEMQINDDSNSHAASSELSLCERKLRTDTNIEDGNLLEQDYSITHEHSYFQRGMFFITSRKRGRHRSSRKRKSLGSKTRQRLHSLRSVKDSATTETVNECGGVNNVVPEETIQESETENATTVSSGAIEPMANSRFYMDNIQLERLEKAYIYSNMKDRNVRLKLAKDANIPYELLVQWLRNRHLTDRKVEAAVPSSSSFKRRERRSLKQDFSDTDIKTKSSPIGRNAERRVLRERKQRHNSDKRKSAISNTTETSEAPHTEGKTGALAKESTRINQSDVVGCGICGVIYFFSSVSHTTMFGVNACVPCRNFIAGLVEDIDYDDQVRKLVCVEGSENCSIPAKETTRNMKKPFCKACWLALCLQRFEIPAHLYNALLRMLPPLTRNKLRMSKIKSGDRMLRSKIKTEPAKTQSDASKTVDSNIEEEPPGSVKDAKGEASAMSKQTSSFQKRRRRFDKETTKETSVSSSDVEIPLPKKENKDSTEEVTKEAVSNSKSLEIIPFHKLRKHLEKRKEEVAREATEISNPASFKRKRRSFLWEVTDDSTEVPAEIPKNAEISKVRKKWKSEFKEIKEGISENLENSSFEKARQNVSMEVKQDFPEESEYLETKPAQEQNGNSSLDNSLMDVSVEMNESGNIMPLTLKGRRKKYKRGPFFKTEQREVLEESFQKCSSPSLNDLKNVSEKIEASLERVVNWFNWKQIKAASELKTEGNKRPSKLDHENNVSLSILVDTEVKDEEKVSSELQDQKEDIVAAVKTEGNKRPSKLDHENNVSLPILVRMKVKDEEEISTELQDQKEDITAELKIKPDDDKPEGSWRSDDTSPSVTIKNEDVPGCDLQNQEDKLNAEDSCASPTPLKGRKSKRKKNPVFTDEQLSEDPEHKTLNGTTLSESTDEVAAPERTVNDSFSKRRKKECSELKTKPEDGEPVLSCGSNNSQTIEPEVEKNDVPEIEASGTDTQKQEEKLTVKGKRVRKKKRKTFKWQDYIFTDEQRSVLEESYIRDESPSDEAVNKLSDELAVSVRRINNWFSRRRTKDCLDTSTASTDVLSLYSFEETAPSSSALEDVSESVNNDELPTQVLSLNSLEKSESSPSTCENVLESVNGRKSQAMDPNEFETAIVKEPDESSSDYKEDGLWKQKCLVRVSRSRVWPKLPPELLLDPSEEKRLSETGGNRNDTPSTSKGKTSAQNKSVPFNARGWAKPSKRLPSEGSKGSSPTRRRKSAAQDEVICEQERQPNNLELETKTLNDKHEDWAMPSENEDSCLKSSKPAKAKLSCDEDDVMETNNVPEPNSRDPKITIMNAQHRGLKCLLPKEKISSFHRTESPVCELLTQETTTSGKEDNAIAQPDISQAPNENEQKEVSTLRQRGVGASPRKSVVSSGKPEGVAQRKRKNLRDQLTHSDKRILNAEYIKKNKTLDKNTQVRLAKKLGVTSNAVNKWLQKKERKNVSDVNKSVDYEVFLSEELQIALESKYEENERPNKTTLCNIADALKLPPKFIYKWFKNKRMATESAMEASNTRITKPTGSDQASTSSTLSMFEMEKRNSDQSSETVEHRYFLSNSMSPEVNRNCNNEDENVISPPYDENVASPSHSSEETLSAPVSPCISISSTDDPTPVKKPHVIEEELTDVRPLVQQNILYLQPVPIINFSLDNASLLLTDWNM